ncbi:MAG: 6-hydroxymethylpterin diphosphokinase MptE-like protein [Pseudomonadota bacterium]
MIRVLKRFSSFRYFLAALLLHCNDREYLHWYVKHRSRLLKFKNIHQGQGCFIIGNGPSLNKTNLSALKKYHTFGLNKIYLLFDKVDLNLSYHVAVNPLVIEQSTKELESLRCPSFLSYRPARHIVNHRHHIYFIMTNGNYLFETDLSRQLCEGYTVTYVALQIAFYMGFSQVFLVGVDHNFKATGTPNDKQFLRGDDQNHFDPNYFGNREWHLPDLEASELSYHLANFHFRRDGRQVYDATVDGKLNIFPKISYEQALEMCGAEEKSRNAGHVNDQRNYACL